MAARLTDPQGLLLQRIHEYGPDAWATNRSRTGGAVSRMADRLMVAGLLTGPPFELTFAGRKALDEWRFKQKQRWARDPRRRSRL